MAGELNAKTCIRQRSLNAINFYNQPNKYFSISRTTPWSDPNDPDINDDNPPVPTGLEVTIDDPIAYILVSNIVFCKESPETGTLSYRGILYDTTSDPNVALNEGYTYCYLSSTMVADQVPLVKFRQVGVFSRVEGTPDTNGLLYPPDSEYAPSTSNIIQNEGVLAALSNRVPVPRSKDTIEVLEIMLKF